VIADALHKMIRVSDQSVATQLYFRPYKETHEHCIKGSDKAVLNAFKAKAIPKFNVNNYLTTGSGRDIVDAPNPLHDSVQSSKSSRGTERRTSVNEIIDHGIDVPKIPFCREENLLAWMNTRLIMQNFGTRFRFRLEVREPRQGFID
jgi:hypothetical protein